MQYKRRAMLLILFLVLVDIFVFEISPAQAEPYLAMRTGFKCSQCHVNQTGGGKRTEFGVIYSQTNLYMKRLQSANRPVFFDGILSPTISIGANLRIDNISLFAYQNSKGTKEKFSNNSRIPEANLYIQFAVVPDVLSIYADQTLAPNPANREFFGIIQNLPLNSYVKVGRMLLPYGLRLLDNEAFIRNETGFTYNKHDVGLELGLEPGPYSLIANLTQNQLSAVGSVLFQGFRIGGSFGRNTKTSNDYMLGVFAGTNFGRFTFLGEADFIRQDDIWKLAGIAELNYLISRGFNFKTTYEFFDRNRDISYERDGQERITLGVEPFITQFLQIGIFYRINRFIPQNISLNQDQLIIQFHVFL
jgi:hypothetical protein